MCSERGQHSKGAKLSLAHKDTWTQRVHKGSAGHKRIVPVVRSCAARLRCASGAPHTRPETEARAPLELAAHANLRLLVGSQRGTSCAQSAFCVVDALAANRAPQLHSRTPDSSLSQWLCSGARWQLIVVRWPSTFS